MEHSGRGRPSGMCGNPGHNARTAMGRERMRSAGTLPDYREMHGSESEDTSEDDEDSDD